MRFAHIFILCSGLLFAGCATQQTSVVQQTLQSYRVGVTKFDDFKRDAGLVELPSQVDSPQQAGRYKVPVGSPWRLYSQGQSSNFQHWTWTQKWSFVVGDTNEALSTLWFDASGTLVDISTPQLP